MLIKTDDLVEHCVTSLLARKMHELFRLKQTDKNRLVVKIVYDLIFLKLFIFLDSYM
jgi:hypothetical protein